MASLDRCNMKVFPADPASATFTSAFANVKFTEEVVEQKSEEPSLKETSLSEVPDEGSLKNVNFDGGRRDKPEPVRKSSSTAPPPLISYEYPSLPITKCREELISLIENNSVVIVRGATGCGKTTQVPQYILDHYNEKNTSCNIVVTQPRKIGATSIARWVATQRKCTLGSLVGYQVGLEKIATEHTRLIYMTTGVLLQKLVSAKSLTEYSHIFVDEVHERTEEMDFLLLVLRKLLHLNSRYVKIILMSATVNCKQFAEYFSTPIYGTMNPAYVFEVDGAPYAVEEFYLDDLHSQFPFRIKSPHPDDPHISVEMYNLAIGLIQSFDEMEGKDSSKAEEKDGRHLSERGSVLVFLPGLHEISYMMEALARLSYKRLQVYPLHSSVILEEQNGVFRSTVPGYRKVILSTNIAESSVTVPDVKYVIDFCLVRRLVCDQDTNYQSLHLTWASKTNCNQRRGRAGRVSKGYCYRFITREFWRNEIPDYMIPEMLLSPLGTIMLKVKLLDMGDPRSLLSTALSPPNLDDIVKTVLQLKEMGALSSKSRGERSQNEDGELTFLGRVLAHLPVDLYLGKMIVLGHVFGCLDECLIMAASHSLKSFFAVPSMELLAGYRSKLAFAHDTQSDSLAFLNAFKSWDSCKKKGQLRHSKDEQDWGRENFIQIKRIREVAELYEDLKKRVSQFNMYVSDVEPLDYTSTHRQKFILQVVIAGAYYSNYLLQSEIDDELAYRELSGFNPRTTVMVRSLPPYSFLYYKQLQSLFRLCGQVKAISFESSRAYVEFHRTSQDSRVLPEVSLSLLLAQQSPSLELSIYPTEQIESYAGNRNISHLKYSRVNVDFQNHSVCPVGLVNSPIEPEKLPPNRLFVVNITEVVDVGHFFGFQADEASLKKQRQLTAEINMRRLCPVTVSLCPNLLCLAPWSETNEQSLYYRAKILYMRGNRVEVFFLDFGNTAVVACRSLRELPCDLLSHAFQAQEFQNIGIRPSGQSIVLGNQWSSRARDRFFTLVNGQSLMASLYSILHGVMRVQLLINTETTNTSVEDILVEEGHAVKTEEAFDSKQIHEELMSLYQDLKLDRYVPNATSSSWKERKKEDKELIDSLLTHFSKSHQSCSKTNVRLHGPTTPHKIKVHSFGHTTYYKSLCIERNSINSLALNVNSHYKHQRMLVAGTVSVSSTGTSILLGRTSLMPDISGLPALVTMLFTPVMELRTNEEGTCYTGALCGLGWNSQTQEGILPEHDIELAFDVKFDVEDIIEINALRLAISRLVSDGPLGILHLGPDKITNLQEDCRDCLTRLFTKSRELVTPVYYEKPEKWNQVDPSLIMEAVNDGRMTGGLLFQPHPVTLLNS